MGSKRPLLLQNPPEKVGGFAPPPFPVGLRQEGPFRPPKIDDFRPAAPGDKDKFWSSHTLSGFRRLLDRTGSADLWLVRAFGFVRLRVAEVGGLVRRRLGRGRSAAASGRDDQTARPSEEGRPVAGQDADGVLYVAQ